MWDNELSLAASGEFGKSHNTVGMLTARPRKIAQLPEMPEHVKKQTERSWQKGGYQSEHWHSGFPNIAARFSTDLCKFSAEFLNIERGSPRFAFDLAGEADCNVLS